MKNLTHWDFAENFSGFDAAALMLGIEPRESDDDDDSRIRVVIDRMALHYNHALKRHYQEAFNLNSADFMDTETDRPFELESVEMNELRRQCNFDDEENPFSDWLASEHQAQFEDQIFSRHAIADWLVAIGLNSNYQFELVQPNKPNDISHESDIDPTDLPAELDAANMAFRAVTNGYGDQSKKPRIRLVDYLKKRHPELSPEAVERIATVANPVKTPGGMKSDKL